LTSRKGKKLLKKYHNFSLIGMVFLNIGESNYPNFLNLIAETIMEACLFKTSRK